MCIKFNHDQMIFTSTIPMFATQMLFTPLIKTVNGMRIAGKTLFKGLNTDNDSFEPLFFKLLIFLKIANINCAKSGINLLLFNSYQQL